MAPSTYSVYTGGAKYHLYAADSYRYVNVPVFYREGTVLYVLDIWPFKVAEIGDIAEGIESIIAVSGSVLNELITGGYAAYAAARIRGDN